MTILLDGDAFNKLTNGETNDLRKDCGRKLREAQIISLLTKDIATVLSSDLYVKVDVRA